MLPLPAPQFLSSVKRRGYISRGCKLAALRPHSDLGRVYLLKKIYLCVCVLGVVVCVWDVHVHVSWAGRGPEEAIGAPGTGVRGRCELLCGF